MKWVALCLAVTSCVFAQKEVTFSAEVQLVMLDVQVTEKNTGKIVELLGPKDFVVLDDGKPREIREFGFETTPLDIVIVQYAKGGISIHDINEFRRGLKGMVDELRPVDRAAVIRPNSESKVDLAMTDDADSVGRSLLTPRRGIYPYAGRLYDTLMFAISAFPRPRDRMRRRAIVAITTDIEQHSKVKLDPLITELLEANTTLNGVILSLGSTGGETITCSPIPRIPCVNKSLGGGARDGKSVGPAIEATGGEAISGDLISERLPEIIRRIRLRYSLGFYAEPISEREFRIVEVQLTPEARKRYPNSLIRTRRGYYTEPRTDLKPNAHSTK